jgi:hypothetical protein
MNKKVSPVDKKTKLIQFSFNLLNHKRKKA